jgi:hypothetical protein
MMTGWDSFMGLTREIDKMRILVRHDPLNLSNIPMILSPSVH